MVVSLHLVLFESPFSTLQYLGSLMSVARRGAATDVLSARPLLHGLTAVNCRAKSSVLRVHLHRPHHPDHKG